MLWFPWSRFQHFGSSVRATCATSRLHSSFLHAPARARSDSIHAMAGQNMEKGDTPKSQHRGRGRTPLRSTPLRSFRHKNKKTEGNTRQSTDQGLGKFPRPAPPIAILQMALARHSQPCLGLPGLIIHAPARWIRRKSGRVCFCFWVSETARMHKMPLRPKAQDVRVASMTARSPVYDSSPGTHSVSLSCHTRFHHVHHDVHV